MPGEYLIIYEHRNDVKTGGQVIGYAMCANKTKYLPDARPSPVLPSA